MKDSKAYKVLILDDQPLFREGIRHSLSQTSEIEVSGEFGVGTDALSVIETSLPDVVLISIDSTGEEGLKLCRMIKQRLPAISVVILTPQPDDDQLFQAIKAHASAYLSKSISIEHLAQTIRQCGEGKHPINENLVGRPKLAEQVLKQFYELSSEKDTATFISPLTPRETEVLNYMAQGSLNKQIADALNVSEQTIKNHITSILRKLNANARTQAVVVAIKKGLVSINKE